MQKNKPGKFYFKTKALFTSRIRAGTTNMFQHICVAFAGNDIIISIAIKRSTHGAM